MNVQRVNYLIHTEEPKKNGQKPTNEDMLKIGYMAGRCGISLNESLYVDHKPKITSKGIKINVNSCTSDVVESGLNNMGLKFDRIA